jgi:hypothetical protein
MILWIAAFLRWGGNFLGSGAIVIKSSQYQAPGTLTCLPSHNDFNNRDRAECAFRGRRPSRPAMNKK